MRTNKSKWLSGIGIVVLSGGLVLANYGSGVTPAEADFVNPFPIIIAKLNQILAKLSTSGGGAGNHTLRWDTNNASDTRFTTAFPGAVLDNNTGLVWEQAPAADLHAWVPANAYCVRKTIGGTVGWRSPSVVELKSVQDPSLPAPFVPASAFTIAPDATSPGVHLAYYWSATTSAENNTGAWVVSFLHGGIGSDSKSGPTSPPYAWCVRGGMNADTY